MLVVYLPHISKDFMKSQDKSKTSIYHGRCSDSHLGTKEEQFS